MKLEYLADGSPECPLIRLYDFNQSEVQQLKHFVKLLVNGERQHVALQNEVWVNPVADCSLILRRGTRNEGVRLIRGLEFECVMNSNGWNNVEGLLEPFCEGSASGFQWLSDGGRVALLISQSGQW
ncbi:MAG TPA: hypothetical protein VMB47_02245 [Candidatus Aquilonibacter sp.]|nr:hypothetical protein [Candidatus Aquilonibacter sp.]